jgi:hypothetical protein
MRSGLKWCPMPPRRLSAPPGHLYAGAVRLRIALIVLALVVLPGIAFAVARDHRATTSVHGWTAYAGTAYVTPASVESNGTLKDNITLWLRRHPDGRCDVQRQAAICATAILTRWL